MKYVSLDLETTGLDPERDQIIMVGAVIEDTDKADIPVEDLPAFKCYVKHDRYSGDAHALAMNSWIFSIMSGRTKNHDNTPILSFNEMETSLCTFFSENGLLLLSRKIILAGKNVGSFDYQFLSDGMKKHFSHRFINPGSALIDWNKGLQSLDELKEDLDIEGPVTHDALDDAMDVVRILRKSY